MNDKLKTTANNSRIIEIISGSHLYGTNTPQSDKDYLGIFMPPKEYVYGLKNVEEIDFSIVSKDADGKNSKDAVDRKLYEFRKFIRLAMQNNPNIIEILFASDESIIMINEIGESLLDIRKEFISKLAVPRFIGYAVSQKHKMIIRRDHFNDLKTAYDYLSNKEDKLTLGQIYDIKVGRPDIFTKKEGAIHIHVGDLCFEPGLYVKKVKRLLKERLDKATNRSELVLKYGYDTKFASHLIRLLYEGLDILKNGELIFPLPNAKEILEIKNGSMTTKEVLDFATELEDRIHEIEKKSSLPKTPNYKLIEEFTIDQMETFLR